MADEPLPAEILQALRDIIGDPKTNALASAENDQTRIQILVSCPPEVWLSPWLLVHRRDLVVAIAKRSDLDPMAILNHVIYATEATHLVIARGPGSFLVPSELGDVLHDLGLAQITPQGTWWTDRLPLPTDWSLAVLPRDSTPELAAIAEAPWAAIAEPLPPPPRCPFQGQVRHPLSATAWVCNRRPDIGWSLVTGIVATATQGQLARWTGDLSSGEDSCPMMPTRDGVVIHRGWSLHLLRRMEALGATYALLDPAPIERRLLAGVTREMRPYGQNATLICGRDLAEWLSLLAPAPAA